MAKQSLFFNNACLITLTVAYMAMLCIAWKQRQKWCAHLRRLKVRVPFLFFACK